MNIIDKIDKYLNEQRVWIIKVDVENEKELESLLKKAGIKHIKKEEKGKYIFYTYDDIEALSYAEEFIEQ